MGFKLNLEKITEDNIRNAPKDVLEIYKNAADALAFSGINEKALKEGDLLPEFSLKNAVGETVTAYQLLEEGPLVISFYRGSWCPYCNIEIAAYQEILPKIKELGANLIAISPETPDTSMTLMERHSLKYEVLSDTDNQLAREFGLAFTLDKKVQTIYESFGIDLVKTQGNSNYELPVPATYVVDTDGTIVTSFVDTNYTNRLDPADVLYTLENVCY